VAGLISDNTLEQIRAASDIVDVIGGYLPLKRAGANFTALCPFHKEKSPSFNVNPHKQIFHCFGCHKGGDVFSFVKEYENIGFVDAVRRLADRAKIPLGDGSKSRRAGISAHQGSTPPNPRADHATLAKLPRQRSRRAARPRLSRQAGRVRGSHQTFPPRGRTGGGTTRSIGPRARTTISLSSRKPG
jgi:DNA primase